MKSIIPQNPCNLCTANRQVGNPYRWQCECDRCAKPGQWRNEVVKRLAEIESILGGEYDLAELAQLVNAKREGRVVLLPPAAPIKVGQEVWCAEFPDQEIEKGVVCSVQYKDGKLYSFGVEFESDADEFYGYAWGNSVFATKEQAEAKMRESD